MKPNSEAPAKIWITFVNQSPFNHMVWQHASFAPPESLGYIHEDIVKELREALSFMIERFEEKTGEHPHSHCGCTYCCARAVLANYEAATRGG